MVLFAIWLPVMLSMLGLLYSIGFIFIERRALQTAADAASTAATWSLLSELEGPNPNDGTVYSAVYAYTRQEPGASFSAVYTDQSGSPLPGNLIVGNVGTIPTGSRGVKVTVQKPVPIVLDKLIGISSILTAATSTAALVPTSQPIPAAPVLPVAVSLLDFQLAMPSGATYDLLAPTTPPLTALPPLLDFAHSNASAFATGRPLDYGYWKAATNSDLTGPSSIFTNLQFWSDGRHTPPATLNLAPGAATLALVPLPPPGLANSAFADLTNLTATTEQLAAYKDAFTAGLRDNLAQQVAASGKSYGLVVVPLWDTATTTTVHVTAVGVMRLRPTDVTSTSAKGQFVLYPAAAWGTRPATNPATDVGARLVRLVA
jgi:Putative Flp pilus-assembly TadE/G-like